jgi:adenine C2-methylase RlmN of 23S rRNA A2503 and tRNA A37
MGMGEPLDNYNAVIEAIDMMIDTRYAMCSISVTYLTLTISLARYYSLSPQQVTISTVGVVPRLLQLSKDLPQIGLALSLHAPTQTLRQQIVPTAKAWSIDKIMAAMDTFIATQNKSITKANRRRHVLVEYVLIKNINDSAETAHDLGLLLKDREVLLNVIPYNPTDVPFDYKTPDPATGEKFVSITR